MTYTKTQYTRTVEADRITCDTCELANQIAIINDLGGKP